MFLSSIHERTRISKISYVLQKHFIEQTQRIFFGLQTEFFAQ